MTDDSLLGLEETDGLDPTEAVLAVGDKALRGLFWTYGSVAFTAIVQIGYTAAISRRLAPVDFGLVAFAGLPLAFSSYFADLGISSAVVQKPTLDSRDVRVAFTGSVLVGFVMAAVMVVTAPLLGALLGNMDIVPVLRVLGLSFFILGFGSVATGLLRRRMHFKRLAFIQVVAYVLAYPVVGLSLAWRGAGVWSLVVASLCQNLLMVAGAYASTRHPVRPLMDKVRAKHIYGFGGLVSLNGVLEFLGRSLDTFAVGRVLGTEPLGQYSRATLVVGLPIHHLSTGATNVVMPGFSRIQDDDERTGRAFLRGLSLYAALIFPFAAVLGVLAKPMVRVLLGPKWSEAAEVLPIIGGAVAFGYVQTLPAALCEARGWLRAKILMQVLFLAFVGALVVAVVQRGATLTALAWVFFTGQVVLEVVYLVYVRRRLCLPAMAVLRVHAEAFLLAAAAAASAWVMSSLFGSSLAAVAAGGLAAMLTWLLMLVAIRPLLARQATVELDLGSYLRRKTRTKAP